MQWRWRMKNKVDDAWTDEITTPWQPPAQVPSAPRAAARGTVPPRKAVSVALPLPKAPSHIAFDYESWRAGLLRLLARKEKALAIPIQAVVVREVNKEGKVVDPTALQASDSDPSVPRANGEEREGVFVVNNGVVAFRPVKTGITGEIEPRDQLQPKLHTFN